MKKILLVLMLASTSSLFGNNAFARGEYVGSQRIIDMYAPPKVIYVVPLNNGYAPPTQAPAISPSTYVAPTNNWNTVIVSPSPIIDLSPDK